MIYSALEDALLAELASMKSTHQVRTLESYGGDFSPDSFGQEVIQYPAVYVCLAGMDSDPANRIDNRTMTVDVYVAAKSLRGEKTARQGDSFNSGAYALAEGVRARLNRFALSGFGVFILRRESLFGYSKVAGLCVIRAEYGIKYQQVLANERS